MVKEHHSKTFDTAVTEGKADSLSTPLCTLIKKTRHFFTSSACSGRIALIQSASKTTKQEDSFFGKWHSPVSFEEVWERVNTPVEREELWFVQQPFIFHIGTDTLENARTLLAVMKEAGIKRGGIMLCEEGKYLIEVTGTHNLNLPIKKNNQLLVSKEYLSLVTEEANRKMRENEKRLKKFEKLCKEKLG